MVATLVFLTWLGVSSLPELRSFWTAERLMASALYGTRAVNAGPGSAALAGLAIYLLIYSLLGALFAVAARNRFTGWGTFLLGVLFSVGWYCLWFRALGQTLMPLVWLLHAENSTAFGHVIFGALLARFPAYLPKGELPPTAAPATEPAGEAAPPGPSLS